MQMIAVPGAKTWDFIQLLFSYLVLSFVFVNNLHDFLLLLLHRCSIPPLCHCLTGPEKTHFWQILFHIEYRTTCPCKGFHSFKNGHLVHGHCPDCHHVPANPAFLQNMLLPGNIQSNFAVQKGQTTFCHHAGHCTNSYEVFAVPKPQPELSSVVELAWKHV